ncbi:hypothetical protein KIN20_026234 [Parelaphostrongylus tenuis]|uniref:Uncharacterized protein n=1 Tax=Parelaphostrongylus tenuis TaxID=148309 RepID=A0AAD5MZD3_PARTN|nr:hypothetical protein KIN20_026234 [Parelaphostrongylus tenuis]
MSSSSQFDTSPNTFVNLEDIPYRVQENKRMAMRDWLAKENRPRPCEATPCGASPIFANGKETVPEWTPSRKTQSKPSSLFIFHFYRPESRKNAYARTCVRNHVDASRRYFNPYHPLNIDVGAQAKFMSELAQFNMSSCFNYSGLKLPTCHPGALAQPDPYQILGPTCSRLAHSGERFH